MGSFSIWHWLIVLIIVMLIFGTKKLRNVGEDLGGAVKGFKDGLREASPEGMAGDNTSSYHDRPNLTGSIHRQS